MMELKYYLFAFYIFVLVCAAIWLFAKLMRVPRKDNKEAYQREQKLFKLYQNAEDMLASVEEYTEEAKRALEEKIQEISNMMEEPKRASERDEQTIMSINKPQKAATSTQKAVAPTPKTRKTKKAATSAQKTEAPKKTTTRVRRIKTLEQKVSEMADLGMEVAEIAKKTGRSTKEVALIMEIKKLKE